MENKEIYKTGYVKIPITQYNILREKAKGFEENGCMITIKKTGYLNETSFKIVNANDAIKKLKEEYNELQDALKNEISVLRKRETELHETKEALRNVKEKFNNFNINDIKDELQIINNRLSKLENKKSKRWF